MSRTNTGSYPAWLPGEQRENERLPVRVTVEVDAPGRNLPATLADLSSAGCRLHVAERLSLGAFVAVRLDDMTAPRGWVAWSRGLDAGIDFAVPLDAAVVARLSGAVG